MIDACMSDVFKRKMSEAFAGLFDAQVATLDRGQKFEKTIPVHRAPLIWTCRTDRRQWLAAEPA